MSVYWSELVKKIEPYTPGEQPQDRKYIKLNTNENPYPPSPKAIEAMKQAAGENLKLYPPPDCYKLKEALAQYYEVETNQVFVGNGSDEILAFAFPAFFNPEIPILFPDITYSFYPVYAGFYSLNYKLIPLDDEFNIPVEEFLHNNGGIIFPNPNAPTSLAMPLQSIRKILEHNNKNVVVVDEAYVDFGGESAIGLVNEYPNLLVIQTLSKARSLAGLRVGYAIGHKDLIEALERVKNSFNSYTVDSIALAGAIEAVKDKEYFQKTRLKIIDTRDRVMKRLTDMGFKVMDSKANFVFISHPEHNGLNLFNRLRERGILVRYFNKPRIDNFIRVSIGTDEEMTSFLSVMKEIISD